MSFQLQNKLTGGLDQDSDSRYVAETDWRLALNIRGGIAYAGKAGIITNVKGNTEVVYSLPAGTNKCIGAYSDVQANTVIYFIYNSNGNHQILRYFIDGQPKIQLQLQYDFGWTDETNITGIELINGRLLYWNDPKPRKINIEKARYILPDGTQKVKEWSLIVPKTISNLTSPYELYFRDENGTLIFGSVFDPAAYANRDEFIQAIAVALNLVSSQSPVTAEACDCSLKLTEKVGGTVWTIESNNPTIVIPTNWYGLTITDRIVDRAKYPPLYEPIGEYQQDDNYLYNYVKNKVFQFRLQYRYDDFENSALGVISQIPIDNLQCDGTNNPDKNYIDVDFNDPALLDQLTYCILTDVKVLAREHSISTLPNDIGRNWKEIIQLSPCEFLDYNGTDWVASYNFYNDIVSNTVADADVAKQYDDVPLSAEENILVKNRSILANVVKGYDAPDCIPATWDVDVADNANKKLYKVKFYIRILTYTMGDAEVAPSLTNYPLWGFSNAFPNYYTYPFWQDSNPDRNYAIQRGGIFHDITRTDESDGGNFAFFGGGGFGHGAGGDFSITTGMESTYDQRIPEGGFTVYAAGTSFFSISKQKDIGLPTDGDGALVTSNSDYIHGIGSYLYKTSNNDLYSEVEIMVPKGEYVFRVASHWCSFGDKLNKGFNYDLYGSSYSSTSTNVIGIFSPNSGIVPQYTSNAFKPQKEIIINVSSDVNDGGTFLILDQAPPHDFDTTPNSSGNDVWQPINGYLMDSNGVPDLNSNTNTFIPIEKAIIFETPDTIDELKERTEYYSDRKLGFNSACTTDHNGYFFFISSQMFYHRFRAFQVGGEKITDTTLVYIGSITDAILKQAQPIDFDGYDVYNGELPPDSGIPQPFQNGLIYCILTTNNSSARFNCSTIVEGRIIDNNTLQAISGASLIYTNGRISKTNDIGEYSFVAWGDYVTDNLGVFPSQSSSAMPLSLLTGNSRVIDILVVNDDIFCSPQYPHGQEIYPISISSFGNLPTDYNPTNHYIVNDFKIEEYNDPNKKTHKRGGKYTYGIRYYDENGRFCSVVKAFEMYLPFITQDLNVLCIQDNYDLPNQYPVGTFKYGKPTINWHIAASQKAPEWAYYYQWMRTKNSIYGRYLQWDINSVTYLSAIETDTTPEIQTSYLNFNAVAIKIQISNIIDYSSQNPNSQVGYSFQVGDRVRLIAKKDLSYIEGIIDYEVVSYDLTTQSLIVKNESSANEITSGMLLEIMNPLSIVDNEEQIYYEVGEVYPCTAPNTQNNQHSVLNGTFTNGDTYWRGRFIPVNDDTTNFAAIYPVIIEDASVSDFYPSNSQDIGRAGVVDPNFKQIHYPTMMQNSGIYVEGSALNGLSSFNTYDYKELNRAFGGIKRLFYVGNTLLSIHENKVVANYIELRSLSDANTTDGLLAVSDAYFGNDRPMQSEYGCQHPNSAVQYNGYVYFLDASKGVVCRTDNNGLDSISDIKMRSFFRQLCSEGVESSVATFDPYYREYVVTITTPEQTKTIAWNEDKNRWVTLYSFAPERYSSVLRSIVSFKDGKLWLHDVNPTCNNFYGVQHRTELTVIPHLDNKKVVFHTVLLQGVQNKPLTNNWGIVKISNDYGQLSRLNSVHFRLKENFWCASFLRDITDTTVIDPIINGRNLRGQEIILEFANDSVELVSLQQIITTYVDSERTPK